MADQQDQPPQLPHRRTCCHGGSGPPGDAITRRELLGGIAGAAVIGTMAVAAAGEQTASTKPADLVTAVGLRVKPVLVYGLYGRREFTSWRAYGGLHTRQDVDKEARRIEDELKALSSRSDFAVNVLPVALAGTQAEAAAAAACDCDAILVYASGGSQQWLEMLAASRKPNVMFLRHKSGPIYLWYEIAHWRFLRKSEDTFKEPNMDVADIVVDDYDEVLWRLRALYGLKNAMGTKVLAIGGLVSYSAPGTKFGPDNARNVWKYDIKPVAYKDVQDRINKARADENALKEARRQAEELLAQPNVTLEVDKKFVVNTFLARNVIREMMAEVGATNVGVGDCMGGLIRILDTPPCLVLSLLNDEGLTGFCHVDFTHTQPGVLLRHISGKPSFVSNSHFPYKGVITLAHCAAPRKMDGKNCEPTRIVTHFESDYGAATKVQYTKGQVTTNIIPNLVCTKWLGFRGKILDSPFYDICRSQMDVEIDGDWPRLLRDMQGFHTITCYGDYLREVGYALKRVGTEWENVSETA